MIRLTKCDQTVLLTIFDIFINVYVKDGSVTDILLFCYIGQALLQGLGTSSWMDNSMYIAHVY